MKQTKFKVISSGKYIPKGVITNQDLEKMVETNHEWIVSRTGIVKRHKAEDETGNDLAYKAALDAIHKANYDVNQIDLIVVASITGEQMTPSVANKVQTMLGITHECMSFDVNAACTGFVYGLEIASALLKSGNYRSALIIGSEKLTNIVDYTDRNTCILFGDGAGALLIEPSDDASDEAFFFNAAQPDELETLTVKKYIYMDGRKVFLFAVDAMQKAINKILNDANLTMDDIDAIVPHQANIRIIQAVSKQMNIDINKFVVNIEEYGNTSAASIPITLDDYMNDPENKDKKVILVGFGGGFTYGSALIHV